MDKQEVMAGLEGLTMDDWERWHSATEVQEIARAALELLRGQTQDKPAEICGITGLACCHCAPTCGSRKTCESAKSQRKVSD